MEERRLVLRCVVAQIERICAVRSAEIRDSTIPGTLPSVAEPIEIKAFMVGRRSLIMIEEKMEKNDWESLLESQ